MDDMHSMGSSNTNSKYSIENNGKMEFNVVNKDQPSPLEQMLSGEYKKNTLDDQNYVDEDAFDNDNFSEGAKVLPLLDESDNPFAKSDSANIS